MKKEEVEEIIACLSDERLLFHYFKDRYCLDLLKIALEADSRGKDGLNIKELKASPFTNLLQKPLIKNAMALAGNGRLTAEHLALQWPQSLETYVLTLGSWGTGDKSWEQTSRPGSNLVLQLNFSRQHDREYLSSIQPNKERPFDYGGHPVHKGGRNTMAWVRIDCSFESDEALIEEIQTDWLREATRVGKVVEKLSAKPDRLRNFLERVGIGSDRKAVEKYLQQLAAHQKTWSEAALSAAIIFIRSALGLKKIYYHSYETGKVLKKIKCSDPPTSLYSQLPRKFCFNLTEEAPSFLRQNTYSQRRIKYLNHPQWYCLPC